MKISRPPVRSAPFIGPLVSSTAEEQEGYDNTNRTEVDSLDTSATQLSDVDPSPSTEDEPEPSQAPVIPPTAADDHLNAIETVKHASGGGFDYAKLDAGVASAAQQAANRIHSLLRTAALTPIEIGRELVVVKESLGHGHFGPWLKAAEFDMSERTAQRHMVLAERLGDKSDIVSDLPVTILYRLAAALPEVRERILARLEAGERLKLSAILKLLRLELPPQVEEPGNDEAPEESGSNKVEPKPGTATAATDSADGAGVHSIEAAETAARVIEECAGSALSGIIELLRSADPHHLVQTLLAHASRRHGEASEPV